jgi:hypothetical protein
MRRKARTSGATSDQSPVFAFSRQLLVHFLALRSRQFIEFI